MIVCSCTRLSDKFMPEIIKNHREEISALAELEGAASFVIKKARKLEGIKAKPSCLTCFETVARTIQAAGIFTGQEIHTPSPLILEDLDKKCSDCTSCGACKSFDFGL